MSEDQVPDPWEDPDVILDRPESTGLPRVEAVIDDIAGVGSVPLPDHARVYERAHVELRAVLDDLDAVADTGPV